MIKEVGMNEVVNEGMMEEVGEKRERERRRWRHYVTGEHGKWRQTYQTAGSHSDL